MKIESCTKESFAVIGKAGSTLDGPGFIQKLWADANAHFPEVAALAARDTQGNFAGFWGCMSDLSGSFLPWEDNFTRGLYLAGVECPADAQPPDGWVKWVIPGFDYLRVECGNGNTFPDMLAYLNANGFSLAGAVQDFTCPATGKNFMLFPIRKLD